MAKTKPVGIRDLKAAAAKLWPNHKAIVRVHRSPVDDVTWVVWITGPETGLTVEDIAIRRHSRQAALRSALGALKS